MDDTAENYNPEANMDDGSCEYNCETWLDTDYIHAIGMYGYIIHMTTL